MRGGPAYESGHWSHLQMCGRMRVDASSTGATLCCSHAPRHALMICEWRHPFLLLLPPPEGGGARRGAPGLHAGPRLPGVHQGGGGAAAGTAGRSSWLRGRRCCRCKDHWGRPEGRHHCPCPWPLPCSHSRSTIPALHNLSPHGASILSVPHGARPPCGWHSAAPSDGRFCPCHTGLPARRGPRGPAGGGCWNAGPAYRHTGPAYHCPQQRSSSSRSSGASRR